MTPSPGGEENQMLGSVAASSGWDEELHATFIDDAISVPPIDASVRSSNTLRTRERYVDTTTTY